MQTNKIKIQDIHYSKFRLSAGFFISLENRIPIFYETLLKFYCLCLYENVCLFSLLVHHYQKLMDLQLLSLRRTPIDGGQEVVHVQQYSNLSVLMLGMAASRNLSEASLIPYKMVGVDNIDILLLLKDQMHLNKHTKLFIKSM